VCTTELVTITKTTSTSTPVLEGVEWVFGEPEVVVTTSSRPATLEELNKADCPPSTDPPAPKVDTKVTPRIDCAAETVTEVTVTTTIDPVWNAETRTWVDGEPVVKTSTSDRNATASEKSACPSPPSKEKPPVKPAANKTDLAVTGGPSVLPLVGGSAALILRFVVAVRR
jgi:cytoskeletal protein RodZ